MKIMITDGGPHPADKLAEVTASEILDLIQVSDTSLDHSAVVARMAKRSLSNKVFDVLYDAHRHVQKHERDALEDEGMERCECHLDPSDHINAVIEKLIVAFDGTMFAEHFSKPEVVNVVRAIIGKQFANSMHIERCWHKDRAAKKAGV